MKHFILADNQDITREGIISIITRYKLITSYSEVHTVKELQEELKLHPESVVILDYTLFDFSSYQQMLIIKEKSIHSFWILFSEELGETFLRQILIADSSFSVIMKHAGKDEIITTLKNANHSTPYLCDFASQVITNEVIDKNEIKNTLTPSEKLILHEIALGKTTKEIAWEKNLSFHTINSHRKNIFRKLGVNNVHEAVKYALRSGIIDVMEYYI